MPSWPVLDTMTGAVIPLCVVTPKTWLIQVVLSTFAPKRPIQVTLLAVVTLPPAFWPKAILPLPVLLTSAPFPTAVLLLPVSLFCSA